MPRFEDIPAPPNSPTLDHPFNIHCWSSDTSDFANVLTSIPNPPPNGTCTPNGLPWSHSPRDFFKVVLPHSEPDPLKIPRDVIWSRSMIEEAWGQDALVKCGPAKEEADEDVHDLKPRVKRPWPVLGISANHRANHYEGDLGVIDEGSDHDGQFEMRADDDQYDEFQKDGEEMLREIHNLVACAYFPPFLPAQRGIILSLTFVFLQTIANKQTHPKTLRPTRPTRLIPQSKS